MNGWHVALASLVPLGLAVAYLIDTNAAAKRAQEELEQD